MKCPKCKQIPLPFRQFALQMIPLKITCAHCRTRLRGDIVLRAAYYAALVLAVLFGVRVVGLKETLGWGIPTMALVILGFVIVTIALCAGLAWTFGGYLKK